MSGAKAVKRASGDAPSWTVTITRNPNTPGIHDFERASQPGKVYSLLTNANRTQVSGISMSADIGQQVRIEWVLGGNPAEPTDDAASTPTIDNETSDRCSFVD